MIAMTLEERGKGIWEVVGLVRENHDVTTISLMGEDDRFKGRRAGQFATIRLPASDSWGEAHPFTISAAPEEPLLRFTIKNVGAFTAAIASLASRTLLKVAGPFGNFCRGIDEKERIVMIAGGVGVTPFLSVLRHFKHLGAANRVLLFWSNKTYKDIFCGDEFKEMTRAMNLTCIHCLSREDDVSPYGDEDFPRLFYERGRIDKGIMKHHGVDAGASFYLCGPPAMAETTLQELMGLGVPSEVVEQERFLWKR